MPKGVSETIKSLTTGNLQKRYPNYKSHIDELLKLASVASSPGARSALKLNLDLAQASCWLFRPKYPRPPIELFKQLEGHIKQTLAFLRTLEKYPDWRDICFDTYPVDGDIVDVATVQEVKGGRTLSLPRQPARRQLTRTVVLEANGAVACINVREFLRRIQIKLQRPRGKRGRPKRQDKVDAVMCAANFFREHSSCKINTYFDGRFAKFCERFYEVATDTRVDPGSLETQIRAVLKGKETGLIEDFNASKKLI